MSFGISRHYPINGVHGTILKCRNPDICNEHSGSNWFHSGSRQPAKMRPPFRFAEFNLTASDFRIIDVPSRSSRRGGSRSSRYAERDAVDVDAPLTKGVETDVQRCVVLTPRGRCQAGGFLSAGDGVKKS